MARKKKPVDDTPIYDPAYLRWIDPLWTRSRLPRSFWDDRAHRRDYLLWLAHRLGLRSMADFYRLKFSKVYERNHGSALVEHWGKSGIAAVQDCFPEYDWKPWLFSRVPQGFWDSPANRRNYVDWLGKELGFLRPEDWYRIRTRHFVERYGLALLQRYASYYDLLRECLPQIHWDRVDRRRWIGVEEILAWADAHHARQGTWPTLVSGEIPGTGQTWEKIHRCLRAGFRGMRGGSSLAKFLQKHRGVRDERRLPPLSQKQILAWADAHFATHGKWPKPESGAIPGTRETWQGVRHALAKGSRGLPGKSSLARLLAKRRGVRNIRNLPRLKEEQILAWAEAYFAARGKWPSKKSGPIGRSKETWSGVDAALRAGGRGLPGNSSLAQLLAKRRGARRISNVRR